MSDQEHPGWCAHHASLFASNGASPAAILEDLIPRLVAAYRTKTGIALPSDEDVVRSVIGITGEGKPFCCILGDKSLQGILVNVSVNIEKKRNLDDYAS